MTMMITRASKLVSALLLDDSFLGAHADPAAAAQEPQRRNELFKPGAAHVGHAQPQLGAHAQHDPGSRPPLYEHLGKGSFRVTTGSREAQAYFDQGVKLAWAFNHAEAR